MHDWRAVLLTFIMSTHAGAESPVVFVSAFAGCERGAIHAFRLDEKEGALDPLHRTTDLEHPFFLALSPDHRFLYAVDTKEFGGTRDEYVAAYSIVDGRGRLKRLNRQSARGAATCYLDVDASGKTIVLANYSSGSVAALLEPEVARALERFRPWLTRRDGRLRLTPAGKPLARLVAAHFDAYLRRGTARHSGAI